MGIAVFGLLGSLVVFAPSAQAATYAEQEGHSGVNTFTNYHNASGLGQRIDAAQWVNVSCKVYDPTIQSVNPDGYWYQIADSPWNGQYYAPANTFMNGDPWNGPFTHPTDWSVPDCGSAPPPPPPPTPGWQVDGPHLKGDFEMNGPYELVFNVKNVGTGTGTYTATINESGSTANNDKTASQTKSVTLAPQQSQQLIFLYHHKWNWIRPDGVFSSVHDLVDSGDSAKTVLQSVLAIIPKLGKIVGQYRNGRLGQVAFGADADKFSDALDAASFLSLVAKIHQHPDIQHRFTYSAAGMASFNPLTVSVDVPAYKLDAFSYYIVQSAKWWAITFACNHLCFGFLGNIAKIILNIGGFFIDHALGQLYDAAWDPTSDYNTLPVVTDPSLDAVNTLPAGELKSYATTMLHGIGLDQAQSDSTVRYAGAVSDEALSGQLLQLSGSQGFSRQALQTMQTDPIGRAMISDALSVTMSTTDQQDEATDLAANFDTSPIADGMRAAGASQADLDALQSIYAGVTPGDPIDVKSTVDDLDQLLQSILVDEDANSADSLSATKAGAGLPSSQVDLSNGPNYGGWYQTSPTITVTAAPGSAPIAGYTYTIDSGTPQHYTAPFQVRGDGAHLVKIQATGMDGTLEAPAQTVPIRIDATAPSIQAAPSPGPNPLGWNNVPVTLGFTCDDATAGIATCPPSQTFSAEGANQSGSGSATDFADNAASASYSNINLDFTPPDSAVTPPQTSVFVKNVSLTGTWSDNLSGVATVGVVFTPVLAGKAARLQAIFGPKGGWQLSTSTLSPGVYDVRVGAIDKAGNLQQQIRQPVRIWVL